MKNHSTRLIFAALAIFTLTFFTSCDNFLKGSDVKQQLEDLIAYENALTHQLIVRSDPAMGSFLSEGEKDCKLGFTTDLQFTMNTEDYVFHGFEAVCVNDTTQSRADCVEFTINQAESDPSKGIYKVTVKLLKAVNDILIRPVCVLIPAVDSYSPDSSSPNYLNTPIRIHFNMPVDPLIVLAKDEQGNYANISIKYLNEDISEMFETPYFDSSNTNLLLTPKGGELKEYFNNNNTAYYDFDISIKNFFVLQNVDGKDYNLSLKGNGDSGYNFIVRYRYATEDTKPVQYIFKATRHEISIDSINNLQEEDEFLYGNIDLSMDSETYNENIQAEQLHNRTNGIFYIYGKFYDSESGIRAVRIKEHLMKEPFSTWDTNINGEDDKTVYYYISDNNDDAKWSDHGDGYVTFCIKHNMESQNGAVCINVDVLDAAGNGTAEKDAYGKSVNNEFTVVKRDYKDFYDPDRFYYDLYNGGFNSDYEWDDYITHKYSENENPFDEMEYNNSIKKLYFRTTNGSDGLCSLYGFTKIPVQSMIIQCKYVNKKNKEDVQDFIPVDYASEDYYYWELDLDVDKVGGTELTLIVADDMGNREEIEYKIPKADTISYTRDGNNVSFFSSSGYPVGSLLQVRNEAYAKFNNIGFPGSVEIVQNNNYKICPRFNLDYGCFYVEMPDLEYSTNSSGTSLTDTIQNCKANISKSPRDGTCLIDVTVSIAEDSWNKFDSIYADFSEWYTIPEYGSDCNRKQFVKGENSITVKFYDNILYDEEITCTVYGVKNNRTSTGTQVKFGPVSGVEYDNTPPDLDYDYPSYSKHYIEFRLLDSVSGPDHAIISINGIKHYCKESLKIYEWDICLNPESKLYVIAETYDKAGNKGEYAFQTGIQWFPVTSIDKYTESNNSYWYLYITSETSRGFQSINYGKIISYSLDEDNEWVKQDDQSLTGHATYMGTVNDLYTWRAYRMNLPVDKFVKIFNVYSTGAYSYAKYFYTGEVDPIVNTGIHDMVLPYGSSVSKVIVLGDGPVFVHTVVTDRDYNECKKWDVKDWEFYKKSIGSKYMDFTDAPGAQQKYEIPMTEIDSGQCYVVIAHFANGNIEMSDVMIKP